MATDGRGAVGRRLRLGNGSDVSALEKSGLGAAGDTAEAAGIERDETAGWAGGSPCAVESTPERSAPTIIERSLVILNRWLSRPTLGAK